MSESTGRGAHRKATGAILVIGLMLAMLLGAMPFANATPSITWDPTLRPGQLETDGFSWTEASRAASFGTKPGGRVPVDVMPAVFASDHDPVSGYPWPYCTPIEACPFRMGVFATQSEASAGSGNNGINWAARVRVNSEDDQGARPALACDETDQGQTCDIAFVKQASYYDSKVGKGPRTLYVAHSTDWGYANSYGTPVQLTPMNGKVDYPSVDVSNGKTYVTWTNAKNGRVLLATSDDGGLTWSRQVVGITTRQAIGPYPYSYGGYEARPALAVTDDGQGIGVAFFKRARRQNARVIAKTSTDGGATWTGHILARRDANPHPRYANVPTAHGVAGRLAFSWTNGTKVFVREFDVATGWEPRRAAATLPMDVYQSVDSTSVALEGTDRIGVAFGGCIAKGCPQWDDPELGKDLLYTESDDGGLTWSAPQVIAPHDDLWLVSEAATVVFDGPEKRYVRFNAYKPSSYNYELRIAVGTLDAPP